MGLPQIIGFGAHKAGTSWLAWNLSQNPDVWPPPMKELHFFNYATLGHRWMVKSHREKLQRFTTEARAAGRVRRVAYLDGVRREKLLTEEWYRAVYAGCPAGRVSFDITPAYAMLTDDGLDYMLRLLGAGFKGVYQLRDPLDRAVSAIKHRAHGRGAAPDDMDFWLGELRGAVVQERSDYAGTITRLDARLADRMLYIPFRRIVREPERVMREVEAHCGLAAGTYRELDKPRHVSPAVRPAQSVLDAIRAELQDQYDFIAARFDAAFVSQL